MKTIKTIFPILVICVLFACKNKFSQEAEITEDSTEELPFETAEKESTLAYLKAYNGITFEDLEAKEKDIKDRMLQFMEDDYFDITIPINASLGTCTLQGEDLLTVTGEIFHDGKPYLSIVVFDLKNDNILGAIYESDTKTLKSRIENPKVKAPEVFTKWVNGFKE